MQSTTKPLPPDPSGTERVHEEGGGSGELGLHAKKLWVRKCLKKRPTSSQMQQSSTMSKLFEVSDATKRELSASSYDVVYSRDTILHIEDKKVLFIRLLKWVKPGGQLLITDYYYKEGLHSDDFSKYVTQQGYHLLSPAQYGKALDDVGFVNVIAEDRTEQFVDVLQKELNRTLAIKDVLDKVTINITVTEEDYRLVAPF
ncbi:hypothetical protein NP493_2730g00001 [Ridgeia piscesae]|uniref:phosphoethanolamine N-methyltransferase n=1 Tax=Ridgeia piscesae TaxID=27915 RepID=A0AAD9MZ40_RIDPI|nr:hypothetical protein NP493_2730g00001 [Ridgeia piscesae]